MEVFLDILKWTIPGLLVVITTYIVLQNQANVNLEKVRLELRKSNASTFNPLKLQAYERYVLFLERISLAHLVSEYNRSGSNVLIFKLAMIETINQEFKHNSAQQIYISTQAYNMIKIAKEQMLQMIHIESHGLDPKAPSVELAEKLIAKVQEEGHQPSDKAIAFIKQEVSLNFS
jgi:hypothetical protein